MSPRRACWSLTAVVAAGCLRSPLNDGEGSSSATSAAPSTTTTDHDPTTSAGSEPLCGDGVLADDEQCDDGNTVPDDGCDACRPAGELLWTRTHAGPAGTGDRWTGAAIGPDGHIVLAGYQDEYNVDGSALLSAYTADGEPLWTRVLDDHDEGLHALYRVAVGSAGTIYAIGAIGPNAVEISGVLHAFAPDGGLNWTFVDPFTDGRTGTLADLAVTHGALITVGLERDQDGGQRILVRRHDTVTGEPLWTQSPLFAHAKSASKGVAVADDLIVIAGRASAGASAALLAAYDLDGNFKWMDEDDPDSDGWDDIHRIGATDFVLVGTRIAQDMSDRYMVTRRIGPGGELRWEHAESEMYPTAVGVGPGGEIVAAAQKNVAQGLHAVSLRYDGAGTLLWTSEDAGEHEAGAMAWDAALGAGRVVIAGEQQLTDADARVRVFALP